MIVACVLRSGGDFDWKYVEKLERGVRENLRHPYKYKFVCLSDTNFGPINGQENAESVPLRHEWPRWWPKMELFGHPALEDEQVLYFDLDTVIVGHLGFFTEFDGELAMLEDFYKPGCLATGVMMFNQKRCRMIYEDFLDEANSFASPRKPDASYFTHKNIKPQFIQDMYPNKVVSYKPKTRVTGVEKLTKLKGGEAVVCFHGHPRPHEALYEAPWLRKYWV